MNGGTEPVNGLVLLLLVGEVPGFDVGDIAADGVGDLFMELEIAAEEAGLEFGVDAQKVVHHEDLAITMAAGADADHGDVEGFGDGFCQYRGDLFEDHPGAAGILEEMGVAFELFGFGLFFGALLP